MADILQVTLNFYNEGIETLNTVIAFLASEHSPKLLVIPCILLLVVLYQLTRMKNWQSSKKKLQVKGKISPGFEDVRKAFQDILDYGWEQGGSFAVYYQGKQVVNLWGGYADPEAGPSEWREDTLGRFFSGTKAVSAICLAMLADKGLIDYDEKVSTYWPAFSQNGKGEITVKQLISHQGGLAVLTEPHFMQWHRDDYPRLRKILEKQSPLWPPGSAFGYHPFTHGMYIDELIRRVDPKHRSLQQFFKDEIADVHGIDFYIGLPLSQAYRLSRLGASPGGFHISLTYLKYLYEQKFGKSYFKEFVNIKDKEHCSSMSDVFNNPYFQNAGIGSCHGCGTANSLAKFYRIVADGTLLSSATVEALQKPVVSGRDECYGYNWTWGLGTCLFRIEENGEHYFVIGSIGYGGQIGFADLKRQLGIAFVSRCLWPYGDITSDRRCMHLLKALYKCIFQKEGKPKAKLDFTIMEW